MEGPLLLSTPEGPEGTRRSSAAAPDRPLARVMHGRPARGCVTRARQPRAAAAAATPVCAGRLGPHGSGGAPRAARGFSERAGGPFGPG